MQSNRDLHPGLIGAWTLAEEVRGELLAAIRPLSFATPEIKDKFSPACPIPAVLINLPCFFAHLPFPSGIMRR